MAHKRMFSKDITESDAFRDMPVSSQSLYFHLGMEADDDGFLDSYKSLMRAVGSTPDDLKILVAKRFVLVRDDEILVIKHWLINNTIRKDRYNPTRHIEAKKGLFIKENNAYTESENLGGIPFGNHLATVGLPPGNPEEDRKGKKRIEEKRIVQKKKSRAFRAPALQEVTEYCTERKNDVDPQQFIDFYSSKGWMIGKNKMKDWKAAIRTWEKRDREGNGQVAALDFGKYPINGKSL